MMYCMYTVHSLYRTDHCSWGRVLAVNYCSMTKTIGRLITAETAKTWFVLSCNGGNLLVADKTHRENQQEESYLLSYWHSSIETASV